jgi:hypothetical protein
MISPLRCLQAKKPVDESLRHESSWLMNHTDEIKVSHLLTGSAVRERAQGLLTAGLHARLSHFSVHLDRFAPCADEVVATIREAYPSLDIPFHARWRHFSAGGIDRWAALTEVGDWPDPASRARAAFDLAITSVLLDAGAGPDWRYAEGRTGEVFARSEGLAVASLDLFAIGALSGDPADPFRADASALQSLSRDELADAFQVGPDNPLIGLDGRLALLHRLGAVAQTKPDVFAITDEPRPGGLFDHLQEKAADGSLPAAAILEALLAHLGPIWPGRITLHGVDLGDTWRHPLAGGEGETAGLVPFHKLSQWLAYSLIEPLQDAGIKVTEVDGLTGLPEYRNGGLFLDTGVIALKDPAEAERPHEVGSELVVEWRALTVALLDRIAPLVRESLGVSAEALPLAKVLEGGTWATGRRLARANRPDGGPPLQVVSDGTVF